MEIDDDDGPRTVVDPRPYSETGGRFPNAEERAAWLERVAASNVETASAWVMSAPRSQVERGMN